MKVAVIWSSPNENGLTAAAKESMLAGLRKAGTVTDEIWLNGMKLEHCRACGNGWGTCNKLGSCVIKDDFSDIYERLKASDGIVIVSAVYWSGMTECLKAFVDRLRRCEATAAHALTGKRCVLIACAGGTGRGTQECLQDMERALTHMGMRAYDRVSVVRYNRDYILPALEKAGEVYADRLENGFDMYY